MMALMVPEAAIWRSAAVCVDRHGEHALRVAESELDAMLIAKDMDGYRIWKRISSAIDVLLEPATVHFAN